ncbi:MAG: hypothetical protein JWN95_413 [Frankiales bacterium]|nr:hypothetical protein [Frankiales bacterium]
MLEIDLSQYPQLVFFCEHYHEDWLDIYGDEETLYDRYIEDNQAAAAKLIPEIDQMTSRYNTQELEAAFDSRPMYLERNTYAGLNWIEWLESVRAGVAARIAADPPSAFDYYPLLAATNEADYLQIRAFLGTLSDTIAVSIDRRLITGLQRDAVNMFEGIGELDRQLSVLLDLTDDELGLRLAELKINIDPDVVGMGRRELIELARQVVRDIGSPPAWLQ